MKEGLIGLALLGTAAVFALDLQTPWGVATWILYAFPMFLLCYASGTRYLVAFAALVSGLIVLDHLLSAQQAPQLFSVFNRAAGLATLWVAAWLVLQRQRRKQENEALRKAREDCARSEARLRAVLDHSSDLIVEHDEDFRVRYVSSSVERLLGLEAARMQGKPGIGLLHPDDAGAATSLFQRMLASPGTVERLEVRLKHRDGSYRWFETAATGAGGGTEPRGVVTNSRDITERKRTAEALRLSEERFRSLFELSPVGITIADLQGRFRLVNAAVCRLFGYTADELLARAIADVTHPEDMKATEELRERLRRGEIPQFALEKRYVRKDGSVFWGRATVTAMRDDQAAAAYTLGTVEDITESKEAEQARIEALERQRDALVREVHHRIKNNLQGVVGLLQRHARERPELAEPIRAAITRVNSVAAVHGLHAAGEGGALHLCHLVDAIGEYERSVFPEVELRIERPADWRAFRLQESEAVAVALIVNELALNAIKACLREQCREPVRIAFAREGDAARVTVSNSVGRLPEGFDFAAGRGLGTGLTLAKSLLPLEGARIAIRQLEPAGVEAELRMTRPVLVLL